LNPRHGTNMFPQLKSNAVAVTRQKARRRDGGFTLIETAVVLVIGGLMIQAMVTGVSLIQTARVNDVMRQQAAIEAAVDAFQDRYRALPGDYAVAGTALRCGPTACANGDGNGRIEAKNTGYARAQGEVLMFWRHLSEAQLTNGSYGMANNSLINADGQLTGDVGTIAESLPPSKLPGGYFVAYWHPWSWPSGSYPNVNYFELQGITAIGSDIGRPSGNPILTPSDAYAIDSKMDNGMPNNGKVTTRSIVAGDSWDNIPSNIGAANCQSGNPPADFFLATSTYNAGGTVGNTPLCALAFQFQ